VGTGAQLTALAVCAGQTHPRYRGFFAKVFKDGWTQRQNYILTHAVYLLVTDYRDHGIKHGFNDVERLLKDQAFRAPIANRTKRDSERAFWLYEFPQLPKDACLPLFNKFSGLFLSGSLPARIFSARENDLDPVDILNNNRIFLVNLSRGKLGPEYSSFLGGVLASALVEAAFARANMNPELRTVHHLFGDEFQEICTMAPFTDVLAQAGKYKLALTVSHQQLHQLDKVPGLMEALFANAGTFKVFRISDSDARRFASAMGKTVTKFRMKGHSR